MKYAAYCIAVFALTFGSIAIWFGTTRSIYRKRFGK